VGFVTVMWFDSLEAVRAVAGKAYKVVVMPPKAQSLLSRFDARSEKAVFDSAGRKGIL
jgi:hypothetical protein